MAKILRSVTMKLITLILLAMCFGCSRSESLENMEDENYFYKSYPKLKNKISNLKIYIESHKIREVTLYYKFNVKESDAFDILQKEGYQEFNTVILNKAGKELKCERSFMNINFKQNYIHEENINGAINTSPIWWNIPSNKDSTCFLVLHDQPNYRVRALYDRQAKILYMYRHTAG